MVGKVYFLDWERIRAAFLDVSNIDLYLQGPKDPRLDMKAANLFFCLQNLVKSMIYYIEPTGLNLSGLGFFFKLSKPLVMMYSIIQLLAFICLQPEMLQSQNNSVPRKAQVFHTGC